MEYYIRRPITTAESVRLGFLNEWPIDGLLSVGGFIAGGAVVKAIFGGETLTESYLQTRSLKNGGGDIDIFFISQESHDRGLAMVNTVEESTKTKLNTASTSWTVPSAYKLQLISPRFSGTPEQVMEHFDFCNCKASFDGRDLIYHRDLQELEETRTLRMDRSSGFILAWRLVRYMNKGYTKIHPACHEHIVDWLLRVKMGDWTIDEGTEQRFLYTFEQLQRFISNPKLVRDEDLILAIGCMNMVSKEVADNFMYVMEPLMVDVAKEELKRRLGLTTLNLPPEWSRQ